MEFWKRFVTTLNEGIEIIQSPNIREIIVKALNKKLIFKPYNKKAKDFKIWSLDFVATLKEESTNSQSLNNETLDR